MELVCSAIQTGLRIAEVPSMELERRAGDSNLNAWKDGKRVLKTLLHHRTTRFDPARVAGSEIALVAALMPAHGTEEWLPAGSDTRTAAELTQSEQLTPVLIATNEIAALALPGPARRSGDRGAGRRLNLLSQTTDATPCGGPFPWGPHTRR